MEKGWYVIHTYSGYEQKIERIIRKMINDDREFFGRYCTGVDVPKYKEVEITDNNERKEIVKKVLPSYVLVELELNDSNWRDITSQIVRISGVTGFISSDRSGMNPPTPLSQVEHQKILKKTGAVPDEKAFVPRRDYHEGEEVRISSGPFATFLGTIEEIDEQRGRLKLSVQIFGRSTPVEVDFSQVEKAAQP